MILDEAILELGRLTFEERQNLIRPLLELDDPPLSTADEELGRAAISSASRRSKFFNAAG